MHRKAYRKSQKLSTICIRSPFAFLHPSYIYIHVQSTLSPKGLSEILRDIRTLTYQIWRIKEKINQTTTFHKLICNLIPEVRDLLKILWKRGELGAKFLLFCTIFCCLLLDFHVKIGTRFSLQDKRLFEISEVEIMGVDCMSCLWSVMLRYCPSTYCKVL